MNALWKINGMEFNRLDPALMKQGLAWADEVAPDHWVLQADFLTEGRTRLYGIHKDFVGRGDWYHWCACNCRSPHCDGVNTIRRIIYTNVPPPPGLLEAAAHLAGAR